MSSKFSGLTPGRPSANSARKAQLMESLKDTEAQEPKRRVNFEVPESKHTKLKMLAARKGQSIKEFLTDYIDSLPEG
ncbi:plasmid partition protein ParG [Pseudarthrobacter sp. PS3-L1]|uniref:plasmid partition protein ParG n=1 Tax=Pseudarthrobacter sp. PS3-L1 TaxID=3046207 RepID=UPI0024BB8B7C|nr:plasmid partition protein ParG [Pseudarthrobacter sp. PS3-L1]MDJ0322110.1 plasmid partition protein ParG [Pseudarthrobacter sp. PS3-L1]